MVLTDGGLRGLFALFGEQDSIFGAAEKAPADANYAMTLTLEPVRFRDNLLTLIEQTAGPLFGEMLAQQLSLPLFDSAITGNELVDSVTRIDSHILSLLTRHNLLLN